MENTLKKPMTGIIPPLVRLRYWIMTNWILMVWKG